MSVSILDVPRKHSLDRAAADSLRRAIIEGRLDPGSRLTEARLAQQLVLSRGTIRAALLRLCAEGLVVQKPYSRWEVASLAVDDVAEISALRGSLEALAAGLAAGRMNAANRGRLRSALDELAAAAAGDDSGAVVDADMRLHQAIVDIAGSRRLLQHYELVANQALVVIRFSTKIVGDVEEIMRRHEALVRPILAEQPAEAEVAAREHNRKSGDEIMLRLSTDPHRSDAS